MQPQPLQSSGEDSPSPTSRRQVQLQGPRPPQLRVRNESHMIKKPPVAPPPPSHHHHHHQHHHPPDPPPQDQNRQPVVIYAVSPKVIHTTVTDFMSLVQRLTGSSSSTTASAAADGNVSPAARLASTERTSPNPKERRRREEEKEEDMANDLIMGMMVEGGVEVGVGQIPGILSPAPATLPPISPGFFSPASSDPYLHDALSFLQHDDLSPFIYGNMFMPSPSTMFSAPMVSPSPSSFDLLNPFLDF
ncbi:hypothetical protein ACSBR2_024361 [Camellia fascicularis]